jgi:GNAT superfamily N-acetyltransferase
VSSSEAMGFEYRRLSRETWPDFERLFSKYGGVQAGCWCMFYRRVGPNSAPTEALRQEQNRIDRRDLAHSGTSDGLLVYADGRAVGWCQFALRGELPRIEQGRKYRAVPQVTDHSPLWRITCFFVDRPYRKQGVSRYALHSALEEIAREGGGTVEAFPATHGRAVALWFGTAPMYHREGFRTVAPFGRSQVLVRRDVESTRPRSKPSGPGPRQVRGPGARRSKSRGGV